MKKRAPTSTRALRSPTTTRDGFAARRRAALPSGRRAPTARLAPSRRRSRGGPMRRPRLERVDGLTRRRTLMRHPVPCPGGLRLRRGADAHRADRRRRARPGRRAEHRQSPRSRQPHGDVGHDPSRPRRQDDHPVGQEDRLRDAVRDEQDGGRGSLPERSSSASKRSRVSASRALNGSSSRRTDGPSASARARATRWRMPAGQLSGQGGLEPGQAHQLQQLRARPPRARSRACPTARAGRPRSPCASRQGSRRGSWKTRPTCASRPGDRPAVDGHRALRRGRSPLTSRSSVLLPQPLGPTMATTSPSPTRSAALEGEERAGHRSTRLRDRRRSRWQVGPNGTPPASAAGAGVGARQRTPPVAGRRRCMVRDRPAPDRLATPFSHPDCHRRLPARDPPSPRIDAARVVGWLARLRRCGRPPVGNSHPTPKARRVMT